LASFFTVTSCCLARNGFAGYFDTLTTRCWHAHLFGTRVVVVANVRSMVTQTISFTTRILCACVIVITVYPSVDTNSIVAGIGGTEVIVVTIQRWIRTSTSRNTSIEGTRIVVVAFDGRIQTSDIGITNIFRTTVASVTRDIVVLTTLFDIAGVASTSIMVVTIYMGMMTSRFSITRVFGTSIVVIAVNFC